LLRRIKLLNRKRWTTKCSTNLALTQIILHQPSKILSSRKINNLLCWWLLPKLKRSPMKINSLNRAHHQRKPSMISCAKLANSVRLNSSLTKHSLLTISLLLRSTLSILPQITLWKNSRRWRTIVVHCWRPVLKKKTRRSTTWLLSRKSPCKPLLSVCMMLLFTKN